MLDSQLKRKNKNLVCYFPWLQAVHITKDVVQIPDTISELYGYKSFIATNNLINNEEIKKFAPNVGQIKLKQLFNELNTDNESNTKIQRIKQSLNIRFGKYYFIFFLFLNLRKIDYLYIYNFGPTTNFDVAVFGVLYRIFNPKGILHVRLECGIQELSNTFPLVENTTLWGNFKNQIYKNLIKKVSILGVADDKDFSVSKSYPVFWHYTKNKLRQQLNGYKIIYSKKIKPFDEKGNYIAIIGRLYSEEKGLKILLEALKNIDWQDWKLLLIGELDEQMNNYIDIFFKKNAALRNKLIFTGNLTDKEIYYDYLNDCKIFCMPIIYDGVSLAFVESMGFGLVPIVTDFPGYRTCTGDGMYGFLFPKNDVIKLNTILQDLIKDNEKIKQYSNDVKTFAEKNLQWESIVKALDLQNTYK